MSLQATPATNVEDVAGEMSATKTEDALKCEAQFFYRHVAGLKRPKSYALAFGTAFDRGADSYFTEAKLRKRPSNSEVKEIVRYALGDELAQAEAVSSSDDSRTDLIDQGVSLAGMWEGSLARYIEPIAVQEAFRVDLGPGTPFKVTGVLDLAGKLTVAVPGSSGTFFSDTKTSKTAWSTKRAQDSLQAPIYTMAARETLGMKDVDEFQFHVIRKTKVAKEPQVLVRRIDQTDIRFAITVMELVNRGIRDKWVSGAWAPNRGHVMCSRKYCAFWRDCERDHGGSVSGAEEV